MEETIRLQSVFTCNVQVLLMLMTGVLCFAAATAGLLYQHCHVLLSMFYLVLYIERRNDNTLLLVPRVAAQ